MTKSDFFDRVAVSQDPLLFTDADQKKIARLRRHLGDLTGKRVLEPGCGVGPLTELLSQWVGPEGRILAFDASRRMVEQARIRLKHLQNVDLVHASADTVNLQPESWDLVILFRVFPHFDDKVAVLRHLRPCLAPGGRLVIANFEGSARLNALHAGFSEAVRHDHMPCAQGIQRVLQDSGFLSLFVADVDEEFYVEAVPVQE